MPNVNAQDCTRMSPRDFAGLMAEATKLGARDATGGDPVRSGQDVLRALGVSGWRKGHMRHLKNAYSAGRFHIEVMAMDD